MAAEPEPLKVAESQKSCNTPHTSPSPLATALSRTQGCREGRECSGNASQVLANAASAALGTVTTKQHPQELPYGVAASPGDALPHDQDWISRGESKESRQMGLDAESSEEN